MFLYCTFLLLCTHICVVVHKEVERIIACGPQEYYPSSLIQSLLSWSLSARLASKLVPVHHSVPPRAGLRDYVSVPGFSCGFCGASSSPFSCKESTPLTEPFLQDLFLTSWQSRICGSLYSSPPSCHVHDRNGWQCGNAIQHLSNHKVTSDPVTSRSVCGSLWSNFLPDSQMLSRDCILSIANSSPAFLFFWSVGLSTCDHQVNITQAPVKAKHSSPTTDPLIRNLK